MSTGGHRNARIIHWQREEADIRRRLVVLQPLSLSLLSSSPSDAQKHERASSERRGRASIYDQSRVRNELQPVLETYSYFFIFFLLQALVVLLCAAVLCWFCSIGQDRTDLQYIQAVLNMSLKINT